MRKCSYIHIICFPLESIWVTLFSEGNPHINQCTSPKIYFSDYNAFPHKIWIHRGRYGPQFTFDFVLWPRKMYLKTIFMDSRPIFSKLDVQCRTKNYLLCSIINFLNTNLASSAMSFPIPSNIDKDDIENKIIHLLQWFWNLEIFDCTSTITRFNPYHILITSVT